MHHSFLHAGTPQHAACAIFYLFLHPCPSDSLNPPKTSGHQHNTTQRVCFETLSKNCQHHQIFLLPPLNGGIVAKGLGFCWIFLLQFGNTALMNWIWLCGYCSSRESILVLSLCSQLKCSWSLYAAKSGPYCHINKKCLGPDERHRGNYVQPYADPWGA